MSTDYYVEPTNDPGGLFSRELGTWSGRKFYPQQIFEETLAKILEHPGVYLLKDEYGRGITLKDFLRMARPELVVDDAIVQPDPPEAGRAVLIDVELI